MAVKVQSAVAVFDGSQDFVDIPWSDVISSRAFSLGVKTPGTGIVKVAITVDSDSTTRIEPTARFTGEVDVIRSKV